MNLLGRVLYWRPRNVRTHDFNVDDAFSAVWEMRGVATAVRDFVQISGEFHGRLLIRGKLMIKKKFYFTLHRFFEQFKSKIVEVWESHRKKAII